MIDVYLHGAAAQLSPGGSGSPIPLDVATPAETLAALRTLLPAFGDLLRLAHWRLVAGDDDLGADELRMRFGRRRTLHLHPVAEGAGLDPFTIGVAVAITVGAVAIGFALAPTVADYSSRDDDGSQASYLFNGAINTAAEGGVVPLIYGGPIRAGSTLISAGITSERDLGDALTSGIKS